MASDAKAIMIVEALLGSVRAALVDDQPPLGVGMLQYRPAGLPLFNFHRQKIGKHGQCFGKRAAFVVAGDETDGFEHVHLLRGDSFLAVNYLGWSGATLTRSMLRPYDRN